MKRALCRVVFCKGLTQYRVSRLSFSTPELVQVFRCNHRRGRIILPLLKTLDKLVNRGCLNGLIHVKESTFCVSLLECMIMEAKGCKDVHTLLTIVSVSLGLLSPLHNQTVRQHTLACLRSFFPHTCFLYYLDE